MPRPPISIKYIKEFIEENNGNCTLLSTKYENIHAHLIFKCECGEIYECSWTHVQQTLKMQCNKCGHKRGAKKQEYPFDYLKEIIEEQQKYDNIKKQYCKDNNINFLEIPFWKIENNKENPSFKKDIDKILNRT